MTLLFDPEAKQPQDTPTDSINNPEFRLALEDACRESGALTLREILEVDAQLTRQLGSLGLEADS